MRKSRVEVVQMPFCRGGGRSSYSCNVAMMTPSEAGKNKVR